MVQRSRALYGASNAEWTDCEVAGRDSRQLPWHRGLLSSARHQIRRVPVTLPPYALTAPVFRFRHLAALAGRAPIGGAREVALACFVAARLVSDCCDPALELDERGARRTMRRREGVARHDRDPVARPDTGREARRGVGDRGPRRDGAARRRRSPRRRRPSSTPQSRVGARRAHGELDGGCATSQPRRSRARRVALSHPAADFPCSAASPSRILDDAARRRHLPAVAPPRPRRRGRGRRDADRHRSHPDFRASTSCSAAGCGAATSIVLGRRRREREERARARHRAARLAAEAVRRSSIRAR